MKRTLSLFVSVPLLLITAQRLPAPIIEEEKPTPAPEQSEPPKLKTKRLTKSAVTSEERREVAGQNAKDGDKFLAENKAKQGVQTTSTGLQYKVIREGNGAQPKATDIVTVNYRGTLVDGTELYGTYKRGQPKTFPVNSVIKGWEEALQLMKVGSKYQLFIPSKLAYGEQSVGREIPPNATLIYEVELLDVKRSRQ